jgi:hypothetical protein
MSSMAHPNAVTSPIAHKCLSPINAPTIPSENVETKSTCNIILGFTITPDKMGAHNPLVRLDAVDRTVSCSVDPLGGLAAS